MEKKIVTCEIIEGKYENTIMAEFDDGSKGKLFQYYPDEISFTEDELIGRTHDEAIKLKQRKDIEYLHS